MTRYVLYVEGISWGGRESSYEYGIDKEKAEATKSTAEAKKIAVDFESLSLWKIVRVETTYKETVLLVGE